MQTKAQPDAKAGGWFINLGITGARAKIEVETPEVLDITYVFEGTPAHGKPQVGDKVTADSVFAGTPTHFVETTAFAHPKEESPNVTHGHHWFGNAESHFLMGDALSEATVDLLRP